MFPSIDWCCRPCRLDRGPLRAGSGSLLPVSLLQDMKGCPAAAATGPLEQGRGLSPAMQRALSGTLDQNVVDLVPELPLDDGRMLPCVGGSFVHGLAEVA